MPVHLYGLIDAHADFAALTPGLDGRAVRVLRVGARGALVSDIAESTLEATPRRLREHDSVLRAAVAAGYSPIPARVGRLHGDDAAVVTVIEQRGAALDAAMELVRGRVEMSLLIARAAVPRTVEPEAPLLRGEGPGRGHLRRLGRQLHGERNLLDAANDVAQSVMRALIGVIVAECTVEDPASPVIAGRTHLVARSHVARYLVAIETVAAAASPVLRIAVRGPGAAYSFAAVIDG